MPAAPVAAISASSAPSHAPIHAPILCYPPSQLRPRYHQVKFPLPLTLLLPRDLRELEILVLRA